MFLKSSNCNISSSDVEIEEKISVPKKKLSRKEKKGKQHYYSRHRPLEK